MHTTFAPDSLRMRLLGPDVAILPAPPPRVSRRYAVHLDAHVTEEIPPVEGRLVVHCRSGAAWITHDGDPRDVILGPGESYAIERTERTTVHALREGCGLELQQDRA